MPLRPRQNPGRVKPSGSIHALSPSIDGARGAREAGQWLACEGTASRDAPPALRQKPDMLRTTGVARTAAPGILRSGTQGSPCFTLHRRRPSCRRQADEPVFRWTDLRRALSDESPSRTTGSPKVRPQAGQRLRLAPGPPEEPVIPEVGQSRRVNVLANPRTRSGPARLPVLRLGIGPLWHGSEGRG